MSSPAAAAPKVRLCGCCLRLYRPWEAARLCGCCLRLYRPWEAARLCGCCLKLYPASWKVAARARNGYPLALVPPGERMKPIPTDLVFLSARRTPFGTYGGSLKDQSATDLGVHAARAAIAQAGVKPEDIDNVVFGNVVQTSPDAIYLARHVGLRSGLPQHVPALTVNRLCGSGFQAVVDAALERLAGHSECALVGGSENMSQAPHVARGPRFGVALGKSTKLEASLWEALTDSFTGMPMAITAENLATRYGIPQRAVREYRGEG